MATQRTPQNKVTIAGPLAADVTVQESGNGNRYTRILIRTDFPGRDGSYPTFPQVIVFDPDEKLSAAKKGAWVKVTAAVKRQSFTKGDAKNWSQDLIAQTVQVS